MLNDLFQKLRKHEPTKVLVFRRVVIVISIILLIVAFAMLCIGVRNEVPIIKTTFTTVDSIPIPDAYFFFNINFSITCQIYNNTDGSYIQNETECTNRNIKPTAIFGGTYVGKFLPQNMNFNKVTELKIHLASSAADHTNDNCIYARAFDSEFSAFRIEGFDQLQDDTFLRSIKYKNLLSLPQVPGGFSEYTWRFSRHKRRILIGGYFSYIGFGSNYIERPYIESDIQAIPHPEVPLNNDYSNTTISVRPQTYIVMEETEQRSKTFAGVLGIMGGIWSIVLSFYVLLFGTELISPWGLIQKSLKLRPFVKIEELEELEEFEKDSQLGIEESKINDLEKRVKELEEIVQFYGEYVITTPSATKKPWYKFCC